MRWIYCRLSRDQKTDCFYNRKSEYWRVCWKPSIKKKNCWYRLEASRGQKTDGIVGTKRLEEKEHFTSHLFFLFTGQLVQVDILLGYGACVGSTPVPLLSHLNTYYHPPHTLIPFSNLNHLITNSVILIIFGNFQTGMAVALGSVQYSFCMYWKLSREQQPQSPYF